MYLSPAPLWSFSSSLFSCCCPLLAVFRHSRIRRIGAGCTLLCTTAQGPDGAQTGRVRQWVCTSFYSYCFLRFTGHRWVNTQYLFDILLFAFHPLPFLHLPLCSFSNSQQRQQWWVEAVSIYRSCEDASRTIWALKLVTQTACGGLLWRQKLKEWTCRSKYTTIQSFTHSHTDIMQNKQKKSQSINPGQQAEKIN